MHLCSFSYCCILAKQAELVKNAVALQGIAGDALLSKRHQSSRKRPRQETDQPNLYPHSNSGRGIMSQPPRQNTDSLRGLPAVDNAGFEPLFGDSSGLFGMDGQLGMMGEAAKDPAESLFENTLKAFCCMAGGGGGEGEQQDRPPMQVPFVGDWLVFFY